MRRIAVPTLVVLCCALFASAALAAVQFRGTAKADPQTKVSFKVPAKAKRGKQKLKLTIPDAAAKSVTITVI